MHVTRDRAVGRLLYEAEYNLRVKEAIDKEMAAQENTTGSAATGQPGGGGDLDDLDDILLAEEDGGAPAVDLDAEVATAATTRRRPAPAAASQHRQKRIDPARAHPLLSCSSAAYQVVDEPEDEVDDVEENENINAAAFEKELGESMDRVEL